IPAKPLHAPLISQIGRVSFSEAFAQHFQVKEDLMNYLDHTYNSARISASIGKPNNAFFIAYNNASPVGFIKLKKRSHHNFFPEEGQSEIQKIYLLSSFHGSGASDRLMRAALEMAESINSKLVWLDVIIENERAIRFYQKYGFIRAGHHEFRI